jgi:hypothetical protein
MKLKRNLVIHPLLVGVYPALALLAYNIEEISPRMSLRALAVSLIVSALLFLLCHWLLKDWSKAGLVTSITLILFFSYGHVYTLAETMDSPAMSPAALASATAFCRSGGAFSRSANRRVAMPSTMTLVS